MGMGWRPEFGVSKAALLQCYNGAHTYQIWGGIDE